MRDISKYQGIGIFGQAYKTLFENDTHAEGSIDRILMETMIQLCPETVSFLYTEYTPTISLYEKGTRPKLEQYVNTITLGTHSKEQCIEAITIFTTSLQEKAPQELDKMEVGGIEEAIIDRGSDWCSDVARVACALHQVAGFPARLIYLVDFTKPYSGHVIIEVYRNKVWGAVDPLTNIIYRDSEGNPLSTWELMNNPSLIESHYRDESTPYTTIGQFRGVAISNYFIWRWKEYNYRVSKINDYYRSILTMANQGWPDGLRWLYGEDVR